jgi:peptidoglycan/LPS O-acetylase OafA/YrhL
MIGYKDHGVRPLWVRAAARKGTMRRTVRLQILSMVLMAAVGLAVAGIEAGSDSLLGRLAFPLGLTSGCIAACAALWSWLALRWVDRNDKWAEAADADAVDENRDVGGEG